jgi:hypothetical protein
MNTINHIYIDNDNDDEDKLMLNSIYIYMLINYIYNITTLNVGDMVLYNMIYSLVYLNENHI